MNYNKTVNHKTIARIIACQPKFQEQLAKLTEQKQLNKNSLETVIRISNLIKFQCAPNAKVPPKNHSWTDPKNHTTIQPRGNYGIPCGPINNLIIFDVDVKDDGLTELQDYIKNHGDLDTYTVGTPTGGYQYYFNYKGANASDNWLIANYFKNRAKFRGKGLDIRTSGGYAVGPGSKRNGKAYEVIKNTDIIDMPRS